MNLLPTYEQTIANRQGEIEIPDMSDAIWGRIEAVLDVEMPVPDTPAAPEGKPFYKNPAVWLIGAGILAVIIALFLLSRNRNTARSPQRTLPQQTEPTIKPDTIMEQDVKPPDTRKPVPKKKAMPTEEKQVTDTSAHRPFINGVTDSLLKTQPVILPPPVIKIPPADLMNPLDKKQRRKYGVEVSDSDYRFNVKPKQ